MKLLIAPGPFKGCLSSIEVADLIERGITQAISGLDILKCPLADGGESSLEVLLHAARGSVLKKRVVDCSGREREVCWGLLCNETTVVIELAKVAGLSLIRSDERNPWTATTYGVGQLILAALDQNPSRIMVMLGDSATIDGGAGLAQALGVRFLDKEGQQIPFGGGALLNLETIDISLLDGGIERVEIIAGVDSWNPLCGPTGQAFIYGRQKGATPEMAAKLDLALRNYADKIEELKGIQVADLPGGSAAGGTAIGMLAFLGATLVSGFDLIAKVSNLEALISEADCIITGEGCIDQQTTYGKLPAQVARMAKRYQKPVVALAGMLPKEANMLYELGIDAVIDVINSPMTLEEAMERATELIPLSAARMIKLLEVGMALGRAR